jgi:sulfur carrier protein ThiS
MPSAAVEFLLTDRPIQTEMEFEDGSMLEDLQPILEERFFSLAGGDRKGLKEGFFSSVIITHNGKIGGLKTQVKHGDRIRVFHLLEGG